MIRDKDDNSYPSVLEAVRAAKIIEHFPGLTRAAMEIAYDNGGINRTCSEEDLKGKLAVWLMDFCTIKHIGLAGTIAWRLGQMDAWLAALSDEDIDTACAGEDLDMRALLAKAPQGTDAMLLALFEEVC